MTSRKQISQKKKSPIIKGSEITTIPSNTPETEKIDVLPPKPKKEIPYWLSYANGIAGILGFASSLILGILGIYLAKEVNANADRIEKANNEAAKDKFCAVLADVEARGSYFTLHLCNQDTLMYTDSIFNQMTDAYYFIKTKFQSQIDNSFLLNSKDVKTHWGTILKRLNRIESKFSIEYNRISRATLLKDSLFNIISDNSMYFAENPICPKLYD